MSETSYGMADWCLRQLRKLHFRDTSTPELTNSADHSLFAYEPSQVLPIVFACIITVSLAVHVWQNL